MGGGGGELLVSNIALRLVVELNYWSDSGYLMILMLGGENSSYHKLKFIRQADVFIVRDSTVTPYP